MNKKTKTLLLVGFPVLLLLTALLLSWLERDQTGAGIGSWVWYLLVTLTTVGYGDVTPATLPGRIIGGIFVLGSLGLFSLLIGLVVTLFNGDLLPRLRLHRLRGRRWYLFSSATPAALLLGEKLAQEEDPGVILFCNAQRTEHRREGRHEVLSLTCDIPEVLALRGETAGASLFLLGEDGWQNYAAARGLARLNCPIYCKTDAHPDDLPAGVTIFSPGEAAARLLWRDHPLEPEENTVVLLGGRQYGFPILEKALLTNVFQPERRITYHLFGDFDRFRDLHYRLQTVMEVDGEGQPGDRLLFHGERWETRAELLEQADRVVLCMDTEEETLAAYWQIKRCIPRAGRLCIRLNRDLSEPGVTVFGTDEEIYQPEMVMKSRLTRLGRRVNELYRTKYHGSGWEELSDFHRQSSLASADHLSVKASILLGETISGDLTPADSLRAWEVYARSLDTDRQRWRTIEHNRWMRFQTLYNWRYAPTRDNARRLHNNMLPLEQLSEVDQSKDDDAWELLRELAQDKNI